MILLPILIYIASTHKSGGRHSPSNRSASGTSKRHPPSSIFSDESSLTGESDEIEKSTHGDCFLLSSCLFTSGEQQYAVVISTGLHSQWGKIKSGLIVEAEDTPLQIRLAKLTTSVSIVKLLTASLYTICDILYNVD